MDVDDRLGRKLRPTINTSLDIPVLLIRRTRVLADAFNTAARLHLRRAAVMIVARSGSREEDFGSYTGLTHQLLTGQNVSIVPYVPTICTEDSVDDVEVLCEVNEVAGESQKVPS